MYSRCSYPRRNHPAAGCCLQQTIIRLWPHTTRVCVCVDLALNNPDPSRALEREDACYCIRNPSDIAMWTGSVWTGVASFCRVTPIDSRYGPKAWLETCGRTTGYPRISGGVTRHDKGDPTLCNTRPPTALSARGIRSYCHTL